MLHLGPLGDLRRITPLKGVDTSPERFGGTHTSLSGRRTVDYLGARQTFKMQWSHLLPGAELSWLYALYYRQVRGPLRLLLGEVAYNRLSRSAATVGYGGHDMSGVTVSGGTPLTGEGWPADADPPGLPLRWQSWAAGDRLTLDAGQACPLLPAETVTGSLYVRSPAAATVRLVLDHIAPTDGGAASTPGADVTLTPDTWTRLAVTTTRGDTAPADTHGVTLTLAPQDAGGGIPDVTVAAAQVEPGSTANPWKLGGGAPVVAVDKLATSSLYSPLTQPSMTLVEL